MKFPAQSTIDHTISSLKKRIIHFCKKNVFTIVLVLSFIMIIIVILLCIGILPNRIIHDKNNKDGFANANTSSDSTFRSILTMTPNSPTPETQKDPNLSVNSEHSRATTLTQDSITDFLNIQRTNYPHLIYDPQILQQNTTQSEMDEFLSTGSWRWSQETQDQYMDRLDKNTMIRTYPGDSLKTAQRVYPEKIIQQILYFNTPEGKFLLNDATVSKKEDKIQAYEQGLGIFGYTSGQINKGNHKIVGCRIDPQTQQAEPYLIEPDLSKGANAQYLPKQTRLSYSELPIRVNGFEYITNDDHHATPCNPCTMLNNPRDQSCRFRIRSQ